MNKALVVIPTYDEKDNVRPIAEAVLTNLPATGELLFVDDNSPDGTGKIIDEMCAANPRVHVLHRPGKQGLGRAYVSGFQWGLDNGYDLIFEMDADFSHDPADLPRFLEEAEHTDLVVGSRYSGGIRVMNWPLSRLLISTFAGVFVRFVTGMPIIDPTGGYKCFHREVLEAIGLDNVTSNGYAFQIEMSHRAWMKGFSIKEIPIVFLDRRAGYSKLNRSIAVESFCKVWSLFFSCGMRRSPKVKTREARG